MHVNVHICKQHVCFPYFLLLFPLEFFLIVPHSCIFTFHIFSMEFIRNSYGNRNLNTLHFCIFCYGEIKESWSAGNDKECMCCCETWDVWVPRKCDYKTDSHTDRHGIKWSLSATLLRRQHNTGLIICVRISWDDKSSAIKRGQLTFITGTRGLKRDESWFSTSPNNCWCLSCFLIFMIRTIAAYR